MFNIALRFHHCNGMTTLKDDLAFLYPDGHGTGVGTLHQQRHGWIAFNMRLPGKDMWAAAHKASPLVRALRDGWHLPPFLPPEEKLTEVMLDPGFGDNEMPWKGRLVVCNVCGDVTFAATAEEGTAWMSAHPDSHSPGLRKVVGDGVQHYLLQVPTMADLENLGLHPQQGQSRDQS